MKLKFSLIFTLLLATNSYSREVIVYTYDSENNMMFKTITELMKQNGVKRKDFGFIKKENPCEDTFKDALLHICFKGKELEPIIVRQDKRVLQNTFSK